MRGYRIVVAAHGPLAASFVASAALICGPIDDCATVHLDPADSPESFRDRLLDAMGDAGTTRPLLLLTDLAGGTPSNVSLAVSRGLPHVVVISGINLAVLVEAVTSVETLDPASVSGLVASGREALVDAETLMGSRSP